MTTWTLIHEPDGRALPTHHGPDPVRKHVCVRPKCDRDARFISAEVSQGWPTMLLCGPHMTGFKRSCTASGDTWAVLAPDAPELAAFAQANAKRDRKLHNEMARRLGYR